MMRASLGQRIFDKLKFLKNLIYRRQIKLEYPMALLRRYVDHDWRLPPGYRLCSPDSGTDRQAWADLLNSDGQFGSWTAARVEKDILQRLIHPQAASLLYFHDELVGCCCACDDSYGSSRIAMGMWLMLKSSHSVKEQLAKALVFRSGAFAAALGYHQAIGYTDTHRLAAIYLHLSSGAVAQYDSLSSFLKWWKVKRRLKKVLHRSRQRKKE